MNQQLKDFADAMERGWNLCPNMEHDKFYKGFPTAPTACCANGHAALGMYGNANRWDDLDYACTQQVKHPHQGGENILLRSAINKLVKDGWTTLQVIEWLRSHLND